MTLLDLFRREKVVNLGSEPVRIDPPPAVVGIPCDKCGGMYQSDKLRKCYTINIRMAKKYLASVLPQTDWSTIGSITLEHSFYCQRCLPKSDVQLALYDATDKVEDRHFAISEYQFLQEIDARDDGNSPELFSVSLEQYNRGNCFDCDEPNAQHDTCSSCRRKSKDK